MSTPLKPLRYGEFLSAVRHKQRHISYRDLFKIDHAEGPRTRLRPIDLHRLLTPYVSVRFLDQLRAVLPLAAMIVLFLTLLLRQDLHNDQSIAVGVVMTIIGLMFFMEGVKHGLMPFGEHIGYALPRQAGIATILLVAAALGAMATFAEPAIGALKSAGARISREEAPLLYALLNDRSTALVLAVAAGVGLAVAVGMMRFIKGWPLKTIVLVTMIPCLALTLYAANDPLLTPLLGLAWDCGAITTGPVTVPLVLALGIGVASAADRGDSPMSGFGVVTLASLYPVMAVLALGVALKGDIMNNAHLAQLPAVASAVPALSSPAPEVLAAVQAILPLAAFLWFVQRIGLRQKLHNRNVLAYGVTLSIVGMAIFNLGLAAGLIALGDQAGNGIPFAIGGGDDAALYPYAAGVVLVLIFAFGLGYGATVAEPALAAMGATVENLTDGAFRKRLLVHTVAFGVGVGAAIGVARIVFDWPIVALLLSSYAIAIALTVLANEEFVNLAWDSAGVTTGPVTVPLILALGVGLGEATGARDGFGILAMASAGPIVSVLCVGLWIKIKSDRKNEL